MSRKQKTLKITLEKFLAIHQSVFHEKQGLGSAKISANVFCYRKSTYCCDGENYFTSDSDHSVVRHETSALYTPDEKGKLRKLGRSGWNHKILVRQCSFRKNYRPYAHNYPFNVKNYYLNSTYALTPPLERKY